MIIILTLKVNKKKYLIMLSISNVNSNKSYARI